MYVRKKICIFFLKMPKQSIVRQTQKVSSLFCVGCPLLGMGPARRLGFLGERFSTRNIFWLRDEGLCLLILSALGPLLAQACANPVHATPVSGVHMCVSPAVPCGLGVLCPHWPLLSFLILFHRTA